MTPTKAAAQAADAEDVLAKFRHDFLLPKHPKTGQDLIYLCGNSLGLQPKKASEYLQVELEDWAKLGVEGHFHGTNPWYDYHKFLTRPMAEVVGAKPLEVVVMNALSVNLHLLMATFYRPTPDRHKIVLEAGAFPSDQYIADSQAAWHGFDPATAVVELAPKDGEHTLSTEEIEAYLEREGQGVALVMLGGVNYYTGQAFDIRRITAAAHAQGATVGWDLAHAVGNLALSLHDDGPDFAAWCSYKYLNAGPGGPGGVFVHERHAHDKGLPRLAGWWGNDPERRFEMPRRFTPQPGAAGWQLSNAPVLAMAPLRASLDVFAAAGMTHLSHKSERLTTYLLSLLDALPNDRFEVITPRAGAARGAQLSIRTKFDGQALFDALTAQGVVCDFRKPDVIRVAPVPLYNTFLEVWTFAKILGEHS